MKIEFYVFLKITRNLKLKKPSINSSTYHKNEIRFFDMNKCFLKKSVKNKKEMDFEEKMISH